ncbi:MAG: DUF4232 domain-containing protein [Actinomycetota bacterium]|nr:DUF4232 domain-containing protein [Actinomycetota bacterium]MDQ2958239.1 DUF4232 domain-containing protein [Actinomycetota bacterium]
MTTVRTRLAALAAAGALSTTGLVATAASASASTVPRCGNSSLAVTRTFAQGGAGHGWMALIYRNVSAHTCTVYGYPGLDAISSTGHVLAHATRTLSGYGSGGHQSTVTIRPGGFASAGVEWLNFNPHTSGPCAFSAAVNTVVANTSTVHRLPVSVSACSLQVHPTVAGTPQYPYFGSAQQDWIAGAKVASAETNRYLSGAEYWLKVGKVYPTQVAQLAQLISLPITGLTPAQIKTARADTTALNGFFGTPGLYF